MKSLISLVALFFACLTVSSVSGQVINDRLSLFFEYLSPVWRRHRARFVPYVFANPVHLYRLQRSVDEVDTQMVHCWMSNTTLSCQRDEETVGCPAMMKLNDPLLSKFDTFGISQMVTIDSMNKFYLLPKVPQTLDISASDYVNQKFTEERKETVLSLHLRVDGEEHDQGIAIRGAECWSRLVSFMNVKDYKKSVQSEKISSKNMVWSGKTDIIGEVHLKREVSYLQMN